MLARLCHEKNEVPAHTCRTSTPCFLAPATNAASASLSVTMLLSARKSQTRRKAMSMQKPSMSRVVRSPKNPLSPSRAPHRHRRHAKALRELGHNDALVLFQCSEQRPPPFPRIHADSSTQKSHTVVAFVVCSSGKCCSWKIIAAFLLFCNRKATVFSCRLSRDTLYCKQESRNKWPKKSRRLPYENRTCRHVCQGPRRREIIL